MLMLIVSASGGLRVSNPAAGVSESDSQCSWCKDGSCNEYGAGVVTGACVRGTSERRRGGPNVEPGESIQMLEGKDKEMLTMLLLAANGMQCALLEATDDAAKTCLRCCLRLPGRTGTVNKAS